MEGSLDPNLGPAQTGNLIQFNSYFFLLQDLKMSKERINGDKKVFQPQIKAKAKIYRIEYQP